MNRQESIAAMVAKATRPLGSTRSGGRGYIMIKTARGWIRRHHHVMEQHLGRILTPDERVRHKNGVHDDDRLENLLLIDRLELVSQTQRGRKRTGQALKNIRAAQETKRNAKLTHAHAANIRLRAKSGHSRKRIARDMRVSLILVSRVVNGHAWKRESA